MIEFMDSASFETIKPTDMAQRLADDDFRILRLDRYFPLKEFQDKVFESIKEFAPQNKDRYTDYKGLGLQYDDQANPYYDVVNSISFVDVKNDQPQLYRKLGGKYVTKNKVGEKFQDFFDYFGEALHLIRGRVLIAEPGHHMQEHTDGFCCGTLHYVTQTDPDAKLVVDGTEHHIPADGHFYLLNAGRPHYVKNKSQVDRIHITFTVNPACFKVLKTHQLEKMQKYFAQFKLDVKNYKHIRIED